mgnify:CR=1 FL=1
MRILRPLLLMISFFILLVSACELPQGATSSNGTSASNTNNKVTPKTDTSAKLSPQQMREQRMRNMSRETVPADMMIKSSTNSSNRPVMMDSIP